MIRIVIADDHAIVRRGMKQILFEQYPSAEIAEVSDAEELIAKVMETDWDLVICDMNMPGRSGLDALHQIKSINSSLPVLIMSMYPEEQYALRVIKAGASGYLGKETIHDNLIPAIETVRLGKKYITPTIAEKLADAIDTAKKTELHESLSDREFDVFKLLASGKSVSEIAAQLSLSATTVSTYRSRILDKLNMKSNAELARYAVEYRLI
ncbi:MAG TPA: response regulator transcription factor [Chitinophagaceae bacterium]|nr:response regulator transcription factor [Chitinophagaceae bacterium]